MIPSPRLVMRPSRAHDSPCWRLLLLPTQFAHYQTPVKRTQPTFFPTPSASPIVAAVLAASLAAQSPPVPGNVPVTPPINQQAGPAAPLTGNFFDNTKGNLVHFQLGHIQPIAIDKAIGDYLFAPNNAGQQLVVTYLPSNTLVSEIPTGPGITSITDRPTTTEVWAVDSVNGCVTVIDPLMNRIARTIPVGKEPHGIAMLADGSRAYVTCSASNTVDVIDCAAYSVVKSIAIPAVGPRGITRTSNPDIIWVTPLFSGNDTVAKKTNNIPAGGFGDAGAQAVVTPQTALAETHLPDSDLFAIPVTASPLTDVLDPTRTRTRLGTILFNVHARPNTSQVWIPNTEALNLTIGEANFVGGKVVSNRITIVDTSTPVGTPPTILDLDLAAPAGAAQPVAVVFDTTRNRAYVAAFGSDAILVLDTSSGFFPVIGRHTLTPRTPALPVPPNTPARCGPRGMAMSANGNELFVFNGIDSSFSRVNLTVLNSTAPIAIALGFDPTPDKIKRGLGHLANASHSGTGTSSCMSCHIDGHFDMLSWNLSGFKDPAGTANPTFEVDNKGPMATQSLRGLFEAGALHWRGEQVSLDDFNQDGFVGLLKRPAKLSTVEFDEVKAGTFSLVYPANPRAPADRIYTGALQTGRDAFRTVPAVGADTCASCHSLPLGSTTDLQPFFTTASPSNSGKVPQLRGVGDKLSSVFTVFPPAFPSTHRDRTINGWGLTHAGTVESMPAFIQHFPGIVGTGLVSQVAAFVNAWDTGLAPSTTFQRTMVPGVHSSAQFDSTLLEIKNQALAGHCDIVVATAALSGGVMVPVTMAWDHVLQLWQTGSQSAAFTDQQLKQFTFAAGLVVTFLGEPLGMGRRFGVDRDLDDLLDNDEALYTPFQPSFVTNPDSDGDGFLDGHEAKNPPMHPRAVNTTSPDVTLPNFTSTVTVVWVTATSAKLEFATSEPTRAEVVGTLDATTSPVAGKLDYNHALFVRNLPPAAATAVTVRITDGKGNVRQQTVTINTAGMSDGIRVTAINSTFASPNVTVTVAIGAHLTPTSTNGVGHLVEAFAYADSPGVVPLTNITLPTNPVAASGAKVATFVVPIPAAVLARPAGTRFLHFGVRNITPPAGGGLAYIEGKDVINFRSIKF